MFSALPIALLSALLVLTSGCTRTTRNESQAVRTLEPASSATSTTPPPVAPLLAPYPYAPWRIGDRSELERVVLWVSHILIRFDEAKNDEVNFSLASWYSVLPPPHRSRADALALAEEVAGKAQLDPKSFPELARRYSEDITTKDAGGSLGGVTASQLTLWPQVVDALAAIHPGESSQVVESWYGFHVFHRSRPAPEQTVSGAHIVIGHDQARWLDVLARGPLRRRSRAEALVLANQVYELARSNPEQFEGLVDRYSEHRSAAARGDLGSYSTREPNWYPREVEVLSHLRVGEVAPPIDSPVGFEIIQRTAERARRQYAMESLWLRFDPSAADADASSRASVLRRATALAERVGGDAERFAALRNEVCCFSVQQWADGKGAPALTALLEQLPPGQVGPEPVQAEFNYVIARRIEPTTPTPPAPQFELPAPQEPNLSYHFSDMQGGLLQAQLRIVGEKAQAALGLSGEASEQLLKLHDVSDNLDEKSDPDSRVAVLTALLSGTQQLLEASQYSLYLSTLHAHFKDYLLNPVNETAIARLSEN